MIDSHVHFWNYHPVKDAWITNEMKVLQKDFAPSQLAAELNENGINGCVAVQADQSEQETEFLLNYAGKYSFIKGVVGWIDFRSEQLPERLDYFAQHKKLKGWRHIVQAEPEGFLNNLNFLQGMAELQQYGHTYDILIHSGQLEEAVGFVEKFPDQKFALDHIAKPNIKTRQGNVAWSDGIRRLAQHKNVYCKISGMVTEANWNSWTYDDMVYYLDAVFEHFGPYRLMFGSDWPVCTLSAKYSQVKQIIEKFTTQLTYEQRRAVFETTAIKCYNL